MIKSVLNIPPEKLTAINCCHSLTSVDRLSLEHILQTLAPFQTATDLIQGELQVTASMVIPCIRVMKDELTTIRTKKTSALCSSLINSVQKRLTLYENNDTFIIATTLDPRFRLKWCDESEVSTYLEKIKKKIEEESHLVDPPLQRESNESAPVCNFFGKLLASSSTESSHLRQTIIQREFDLYIADANIEFYTDPLIYWQLRANTFPLLLKAALKYLAVPASSAPTERVFSIAGKIFRPERCRLSDAAFEKIMFIRANST